MKKRANQLGMLHEVLETTGPLQKYIGQLLILKREGHLGSQEKDMIFILG